LKLTSADDQRVYVQIDGEFAATSGPLADRPDALTLLVPPDTGQSKFSLMNADERGIGQDEF